MKYHLLTLGCQMNMSDSERVSTVLDSMGYEPTENENEASLLGILACSVRQKAIDRVYSKIHNWNKRKDNEPLVTFISGCILPNDEKKFLKLFDLVFRIQQLEELPDMLSDYGIVTPLSLKRLDPANTLEITKNFWDLKPSYSSHFEAFIPIQNGCDKFCSFCAVPYTRGREVSRPSQDILREAETLIDNGYKTITLLGQNVNSYGFDRSGSEMRFHELLREIGDIGRQKKANFWTYYTSPHPRDMNEDVVKVMAEYDQIAKQVHLPLQSGDDKVLMKMNRKHSMERYRELISIIRANIPNVSLFTDIIVGFTGESEDQFMNTYRAMEEFEYNMAYIAQYSPRPGATSARWEDDVPGEEKKRRFEVLSELLQKLSRKQNEKVVGTIQPVLITGEHRRENFLAGRTEGKINVLMQMPEKNGAAKPAASEYIGTIRNVKITECTDMSLSGDILLETAVL